jgi:uncharacterized protein YecE (DUF72 family)
MAGNVHIGTSGWNYKHWLGRFYPDKLPASKMLGFYAQHFDTVELNNSFYHLPSAKSFETWRETTPDNFVFAVKGSRFITHMKKLKDPKPGTEKFLAPTERLETKLGPILFQLPPRWRVNLERLSTFLEVLPPEHRYAFEFREQSWFTGEVYGLLRQHNAALCIYHMTGYDSPHEVTADFIYVRFHGIETTYGGSYSDETLRHWAARIRAWRRESKDVYVYFNNDPEATAVLNAKTLRRMLGR